MKALIIGGTGTISSAVVRRLIEKKWEVYVMNRGTKALPDGAISVIADINEEEYVAEKIKDMNFDVVCEFIGFVPSRVGGE